MDQFYMIVLGAIGVLLIIMLTAVGLLMYSAKSTPEELIRSPCPDYWEFDGVGCKLGTVNKGEAIPGQGDFLSTLVGTTTNMFYKDASAYYMNPNASTWPTKYTGLNEVCAKSKWATDLGIVWDGYTNTTEC